MLEYWVMQCMILSLFMFMDICFVGSYAFNGYEYRNVFRFYCLHAQIILILYSDTLF